MSNSDDFRMTREMFNEIKNDIYKLKAKVDSVENPINSIKETQPDLLPCPFCESEVELTSRLGSDKQNWAIICESCKCACSEMGVSADTKEGIIRAWNSRTLKTIQERVKDKNGLYPCPNCESKDIEMKVIEYSPSNISRRMICKRCGTCTLPFQGHVSWNEIKDCWNTYPRISNKT